MAQTMQNESDGSTISIQPLIEANIKILKKVMTITINKANV